MLDTNHYKNSSCAFAEQIVAYLYDETGEQEKAIFEAHLTDCENCAEELSAFGFVRSAVQQWRTAEFSPMRTPAIEIPFEKSSEISVISTENRSWFADLRRLLTLIPLRTATAALAILVVCAGLTLFVYNFSGKTDIAENNRQPVKTAAPIVKEKNEQSPKINDERELAEQNSPAPISQTSEELKIKNSRPAAENSSLKAPDQKRAAPKTEMLARNSDNSAPVHQIKNNVNLNKTVTAENRKAPKLANFDEIEDNSLRLSDLMAEVEKE